MLSQTLPFGVEFNNFTKHIRLIDFSQIHAVFSLFTIIFTIIALLDEINWRKILLGMLIISIDAVISPFLYCFTYYHASSFISASSLTIDFYCSLLTYTIINFLYFSLILFAIPLILKLVISKLLILYDKYFSPNRIN